MENKKNKERTRHKEGYMKPVVQVVFIQQKTALLAGSLEATRNGYGEAQTDTWDE